MCVRGVLLQPRLNFWERLPPLRGRGQSRFRPCNAALHLAPLCFHDQYAQLTQEPLRAIAGSGDKFASNRQTDLRSLEEMHDRGHTHTESLKGAS